jgi:hypothetical protein
MPYEHDLFVSHKHDEMMESWVGEHFVPFLKSFVGNALNRPVSIFFDRSGIRAGEDWPLRLQHALAKSRCLVAVWSPLYFHSEWCRRECAVMFFREAQLGLRTVRAPGGLIVPVNVNDGEFFPKKAREIQSLPCQRYWRIGQGFVKSERYVEFQDALQKWSEDVAHAVQSAPEFDERWLTAQWLDVSDLDLMPSPPADYSYAEAQ